MFTHTVSIGNGAFINCRSLSHFWTIDTDWDKLLTIGDYAFSGCESLIGFRAVYATTVGEWAFSRCTSLATVWMESAEDIGDFAFSSCPAIRDLHLCSVNPITLGDNAFDSSMTPMILLTFSMYGYEYENTDTVGNEWKGYTWSGITADHFWSWLA